jgi:hypothetical protein
MAVLFAPQVLRIDMRQDLRHLELLKTWPVTAASVVRGQLLWPGALITACAWALLAVALTMSGLVFTRLGWGWRVSVATSAAILAPALIFAQLTIHNGVALLFPAWVPLGMQRPRGLDAMGQRLIMLGGTWLLLASRCDSGGDRRRDCLVRVSLDDRQRGNDPRRAGRHGDRGD